MLFLPIGFLLFVLCVVAVSLLWMIVYNWYLAILAAPLLVAALALWLLLRTRRS